MRLSLYASTLLAAAYGAQASGGHTQPPIRNIFTFPKNTFIENIAVRANSNLLITSLSVPTLFSINPTVPNATAPVIHTFPNATGISGIAEITPDLFALVTGVWDLANTRAALGSLTIWTIDFTKTPSSPKIKYITTVANSTVLNGITRHPSNPRLLLAADSALGAVWRVDLATGAHDVAFSSPLFAPTDTGHLGINGLKAAGEHVYFTNSAQGFLGRVKIDREGGKKGEVEVLSRAVDAGADVVYDDFAFEFSSRGKGKEPKGVWIASHPSYAVRVALDGAGAGGQQWVVNDTGKLLNPTSAAFGRGSGGQERTLYVTNGGEFVGADLINEGVVAVDLGR